MKGKLLLVALLVLAVALSGCTTESSPFGVIETPKMGEEGGMQIVMPETNGETAVQTGTETNGDLIDPQK